MCLGNNTKELAHATVAMILSPITDPLAVNVLLWTESSLPFVTARISLDGPNPQHSEHADIELLTKRQQVLSYVAIIKLDTSSVET